MNKGLLIISILLNCMCQSVLAGPVNSFQVLQTYYLSEAPTDLQKQGYSDVVFRTGWESVSKKWHHKFTLGGVVSLDETENHFVSPQAFSTVKLQSSEWELSVGRKLHMWSLLDEQWSLSLWQPHFRWDSVNPDPQGLTGFFAHYSQPNWKLILFASPIFIPDQGPQVVVKDGELLSSNRWFRNRVNSVQIAKTNSNIDPSGKTKEILVKYVEIITIATFIKLFAIKMVAKSSFGFLRRFCTS